VVNSLGNHHNSRTSIGGPTLPRRGPSVAGPRHGEEVAGRDPDEGSRPASLAAPREGGRGILANWHLGPHTARRPRSHPGVALHPPHPPEGTGRPRSRIDPPRPAPGGRA